MSHKTYPQNGDGPEAPHDQPAKSISTHTADFIGTFPTRHNTVTAEVLCRLLEGENLTGMDAVFGCSTTRLAAAIHYLAREYCWDIDHVDIDVGTNDGRVTLIRAYFFQRAVIRRAFDSGALEFCRSVRASRAATRKLADKAKAEASKRNAARAARRIDPKQGSLFGGAV